MSAPEQARQHARWPLISLCPLGLGAWAPIYAGVRAQQRTWIVWGTLWTLLAIAGFGLAGDSNGSSTVAGLLIILAWVGGAATSFTIRGDYEDRMDSELALATRRGRERLSDRERARELAVRNPGLAREIGVGRPDRHGAVDAGLVDVNNAPVTALLQLPGVTGEIATEIIETRERVNGFSSLEDLGVTIDLDGAAVEGLRGEVVFLPRTG